MFGELNNEDIELIKKEDDLIDKSIIIVSKLFKGKKDKEGKPYLNHLYFVMNNVSLYEEKVVGLLHDVIEDTPLNLCDLEYLGYPKEIVKSISILTHNKDISYEEYINRILKSNDKTAIRVKYADMTHNCDKKRLSSLSFELKHKLEKKYDIPYKKLTKKIEKIGKEN